MFNTIQWDKSKCKFDEFTGSSCLLYRPGVFQPFSICGTFLKYIKVMALLDG